MITDFTQQKEPVDQVYAYRRKLAAKIAIENRNWK